MLTSEMMDLAKEKQNLSSDRKLAHLLKLSATALSKWRLELAEPSEEHAIQLAKLAGMDPAEFLIDVQMRTAKSSELSRTLHDIKHRLAFYAITQACVLQCILC